jgi:hypothetical protein
MWGWIENGILAAPRSLKRYLHVTGDRAAPNSNHIAGGTMKQTNGGQARVERYHDDRQGGVA